MARSSPLWRHYGGESLSGRAEASGEEKMEGKALYNISCVTRESEAVHVHARTRTARALGFLSRFTIWPRSQRHEPESSTKFLIDRDRLALHVLFLIDRTTIHANVFLRLSDSGIEANPSLVSSLLSLVASVQSVKSNDSENNSFADSVSKLIFVMVARNVDLTGDPRRIVRK